MRAQLEETLKHRCTAIFPKSLDHLVRQLEPEPRTLNSQAISQLVSVFAPKHKASPLYTWYMLEQCQQSMPGESPCRPKGTTGNVENQM